MKRQMVRGDGWLERGKNKNFALRANFENRSAAVSNVQIARAIKGNARSDAHSFDPFFGAPFWGDAMNSSVVATGHKKISGAIERQARGIQKRSEKRLYVIVGRNFIQRNGNALTALARKGDENVSGMIDGGIRDGMQIVGNLDRDVYRMRLAFAPVRGDLHRAAARALRHARDEPVLAGKGQTRFRFPEAHHRACLPSRNKSSPENGHLPAGNRRRGRNFLNVGNAVSFWRGTKPEFHTQPM